MTALSTYDKVRRLLNFATGEEWGDGYTVTDVIVGYADKRYGGEDDVIVLGDWNPKRFPRDGEPPLTAEESLAPRLADALVRAGAEIEWSDEWAQCSGCYKAIRTEPDSYSWKPAYLIGDYGYVCHTCAIGDGEDALTAYGDEHESYVNNARKCVTWCDASHVESFGFEKWEPGNPHTYANGWYPGQDDNPEAIMAGIHAQHPDAEVVFFLDSTGQFDIHFSAYVRFAESEDE